MAYIRYGFHGTSHRYVAQQAYRPAEARRRRVRAGHCPPGDGT
ncbi:hypothetical protein ACNKHO_19620 [Shigella flexneri]